MSRPGGESTQLSRVTFVDESSDSTFRRLSRPHDYWVGFYTSMLLRDLQHVFPYPRFDKSFEVALVLPPGQPDPQDRVAEALGRERGYHDPDLADALRDFAEECAPHLVAYGEAAYELVYHSPDEHGAWQGFDLALIHPYRRRLGRHQHYIPPTEDRRAGWIRLPAERVIVFRLPGHRRKDVSRAMKVLAAANTRHAIAARLQFRPGLPYDFMRHTQAEREILAAATSRIGWQGRGLFTEDQLEPYRLMQELRFEQFQAELREMIIPRLNEALARAGTELGFEARLRVTGVPTPSDVRSQMRRLDEGVGPDVSLHDVLSPFRH